MHLETERLVLSEFTKSDAAFFYELANDPSWLQFIGDRKVYTIEDAATYLAQKIIPSYQKNGFGFYIVRSKVDMNPIGLSGLIDRDGLEHIDVGYAFLPAYRGKGYAFEATEKILDHAKNSLKIDPIIAITHNDNTKSIQLLERLGMRFDQMIQLSDQGEKCKLFTTKLI